MSRGLWSLHPGARSPNSTTKPHTSLNSDFCIGNCTQANRDCEVVTGKVSMKLTFALFICGKMKIFKNSEKVEEWNRMVLFYPIKLQIPIIISQNNIAQHGLTK